jgi:hypothetical protein
MEIGLYSNTLSLLPFWIRWVVVYLNREPHLNYQWTCESEKTNEVRQKILYVNYAELQFKWYLATAQVVQ